MTILKITQDGKDVSEGITYEIDIGESTKEIEYKMENTSSFLNVVEIKFVSTLPTDSYSIKKIPEKIEAGRTEKAVIVYKTEKIFGLIASPIPRTSKFTYVAESTVEF